MSDHDLIQISETIDAIVERAGSNGIEGDEVTPLLVEAGLRRVAVPAEAGGLEGEAAYLAVVLNRLGYHSIGSGILEDHLAAELIARSDTPVPDEMLTVASRSELGIVSDGMRDIVTGHCRFVPSAAMASHVLAIAAREEGEVLVVLPVTKAQIEQRGNIAGEPRDDLRFTAVEPLAVLAEPGLVTEFRARVLIYRSLAMLGAGEHALDLSISHVSDRVQFGSALSRRQTVQHYIAEIFGALAATRSACEAAMRSLATSVDHTTLAAALATRIEADRMASTVARLSHQLHGAIGFTEEHILHLSTKRLTAWRQDDLAETAAAIELAQMVPSFGGAWELLIGATSDLATQPASVAAH